MENFSDMFAEIFARWQWKPIRNCPGRFILSSGATNLTVEEICGAPVEQMRFVSDVVPDEIIVVKFETGGLISYVKENNRLLHTLGDANGFARKLWQLKILPDDL